MRVGFVRDIRHYTQMRFDWQIDRYEFLNDPIMWRFVAHYAALETPTDTEMAHTPYSA